jgi:hypothetical protein
MSSPAPVTAQTDYTPHPEYNSLTHMQLASQAFDAFDEPWDPRVKAENSRWMIFGLLTILAGGLVTGLTDGWWRFGGVMLLIGGACVVLDSCCPDWLCND